MTAGKNQLSRTGYEEPDHAADLEHPQFAGDVPALAPEAGRQDRGHRRHRCGEGTQILTIPISNKLRSRSASIRARMEGLVDLGDEVEAVACGNGCEGQGVEQKGQRSSTRHVQVAELQG